MGLRHHEAQASLTSVNLLQQTPLDKVLGDVLVSNPRVLRLIEFKRLANDSDKEETKLESLASALSRREHLKQVSRKIHWYAESEMRESLFRTRVIPYLDHREAELDAAGRTLDLAAFIDTIADDALHSPAVSSEEEGIYKEYLYVVCHCQGGVSTSSGGLLLQVTADNKLHYVAISDLRHLLLKYESVIQLKEQVREIKIHKQLERDEPQEVSVRETLRMRGPRL